jgi:hypothetical protein
MKYKVGDKVRIREDLEVGKGYNNCTFIRDMKKYKGEIATITYCYDDGSYDIDLDEGAWFWTDDMFKDIDDVATNDMIIFSESNTVDIGYYLEYCGHKIIKNVYYGGYAHDHNHVFCTTADSKNQYTLPVNSIEFIIPHEVD